MIPFLEQLCQGPIFDIVCSACLYFLGFGHGYEVDALRQFAIMILDHKQYLQSQSLIKINKFYLQLKFVIILLKKMKQFLTILLISLLFVVETTQRIPRISGNLNDFNIQNQTLWAEFVQNIESIEVQGFLLQNIIVSEKGLEKLFGLRIDNITTLIFRNIVFTKKMMTILLRSKIFPHLTSLTLENCNIHDEDFESLNIQTSALQVLSLSGNRIKTKGFEKLSKVKFPNLYSLDIEGNSLVQDEAAGYLIKMLEHPIRLLLLNIGSTSISEENLLKIFNYESTYVIQIMSLQYLDLSVNFWKEFSKLKFASLRQVDLTGLLIDEEAIHYLKQMSLPILDNLLIGQNSLKTQTAISFINREIMPKLYGIDLSLNFVNIDFMRHLRQQKYVFLWLSCRVFNMETQAILQIQKMDLSQLLNFQYSYMNVKPQYISKFFKKANFNLLQRLYMIGLIDAGPLLSYILQRRFLNLREVDISSLENQQNYTLPKLKREPYLPSLQKLTIGCPQMNYEDIRDFVLNITIVCPLIQQLTITTYIPQLYKSILDGEFQHAESQFVLVMQNMKFLIVPKNVSKLLNANIPDLIHKNYTLNHYQVPKGIDYVGQIISLFSFDEIQFLVDGTRIGFLKDYRKRNGDCIMYSLSTLYYHITDKNDFQNLLQCAFPNLQTLTINITFSELQVFPFLNTTLFPDVRTLRIISSNPKPQIIQDNFVRFSYYRITNLILQYLNLKDQHFNSISKYLYFHRLEELHISGNFLFSTNQTLLFNDLDLTSLDVSGMIIGQNIIAFCDLNTDFLQSFDLQNNGIFNDEFVDFINCKKDKMPVFFPQLIDLEIGGQNYITSQGIQALFNSKLPLIQALGLSRINDPHLFNVVFGSPYSRRLQSFVAQQNYLQSIDPGINPKNTRRLATFGFMSKSLNDDDYQVLGTFQFLSLLQIQLILYKITECQTINSIRNVVSRANLIIINIIESDQLNAECLKHDQNMSKMMIPSEMSIQSDSPYSYLSKFANSFLNPGQKIQKLQLPFTYVSDQKIMEMAKQSNIAQIRDILLFGNNLTQYSIKPLLSHDLPLLGLLQLHKNNYLGGESLKGIQNRTYEHLQIINLAQTIIGDKGAKYLGSAKFPSLLSLSVANTDITSKGLRQISKMQAPNLVSLDISCNSLKIDDLLKLNVTHFPYLQQIKIYPFMLEDDIKTFNNHLLSERHRINIVTSVQYLK